MFDFYERRRLKTLLGSPFVRIGLLGIFFLIAWSAYVRYDIAKEMEVRRFTVETEVSRLQAQRTTLETQVQYLSDDRGIEAEMRRQYDVALPNEQVVVIVEPDTLESSSTVSSDREESPKAWYEFWR